MISDLWGNSFFQHSLYANNFSLSFLPCVGDAADCKLVEDKPITLILPVHIQPGQASSQNYRLESQLLLTGKQHWMKDDSESDNIIQEGPRSLRFSDRLLLSVTTLRSYARRRPHHYLITIHWKFEQMNRKEQIFRGQISCRRSCLRNRSSFQPGSTRSGVDNPHTKVLYLP